MVTWYTYTLWKDFHSPPLHLGNSHIHHLTYLSCVWDHLSSTLLVNFSCRIMLSTVVTMFYTRSSILILLRADSLYPFNNLSLFPHPPAHGNHHFFFFFGWLFHIYFAYVKCVYSWIQLDLNLFLKWLKSTNYNTAIYNHFSLCFYELAFFFFWDSTCKLYHEVFVFLSGLFHFA